MKLQRVNRRKLSFSTTSEDWQLVWKKSELFGFFRIEFSKQKKEETTFNYLTSFFPWTRSQVEEIGPNIGYFRIKSEIFGF